MISAAAIHQLLNNEAQAQNQIQTQARGVPCSNKTTGISIQSLPPTIDEDDPFLAYPPEKWVASMIGNTGLLYRFTDDIVYKSNVTPREVDLMEAAGSLTMRPLSRVLYRGSDSTRSKTDTKGVLMEAGKRFNAHRIPKGERQLVVLQMFLLVEKLHKRGIIHGNIKGSNFLWSQDGRLKIVDFSSGRFIEENHDRWNKAFVSHTYLTPERMACRQQGHLPAPTVFDDYYALAIALWSMYSGKVPHNGQFNQPHIQRADLMEADDEMIRGWIRKVFRMAGCKINAPYRTSDPNPQPQRGSQPHQQAQRHSLDQQESENQRRSPQQQQEERRHWGRDVWLFLY
ncbi:kinase-like domain-containing protein [Podospora australis]|uniref:Kinase-like domain-containing protein n=1 Tax=Podospora australis TaxID=1536484 RepID=A0AAN7AD82_9PEZI|nr:kinase-like domain-containing protein [Podospora australis]